MKPKRKCSFARAAHLINRRCQKCKQYPKSDLYDIVSALGVIGEKGDPGAPGAPGAQGIQGIQGDPGLPGTTDYNGLTNQPAINGVNLTGNQTSAALGILQPIPYSAVEQVVPGVTWTGGETVYQISWEGTTGTALNVSNQLGLTIANLDHVVYLMGGIINSAGSHLPNNYAGAGFISFDLDINGVLQEIHSLAAYSSAPMFVTIQYTKTV